MRKAQALIVQFIIFFVAGFILFLSVGTFFKLKSDEFGGDALSYSNKLMSSYLSSIAISLVDTCKQCDYSKVYVKIPELDYSPIFKLDSKGLRVTSPQEKSFSSSLHNLNESLSMSGEVMSRAITLTFDRTKNKLTVE